MRRDVNRINNSKYCWYEKDNTIYVLYEVFQAVDKIYIGMFVFLVINLAFIICFDSPDALKGFFVPSSIIKFSILSVAVLLLPAFAIWLSRRFIKICTINEREIIFSGFWEGRRYAIKEIEKVEIKNIYKKIYFKARFKESNLLLYIETSDGIHHKVVYVYLKVSSLQLENFRERLIEFIGKAKLLSETGKKSVSEAFGILSRENQEPVSVEEMNEKIKDSLKSAKIKDL